MSFYKSLFNLTQVEADVLRFPTGAAQGLFLVCADSDGTFSWQSIGNYAVTNLTGTANRIIITNNGGGSYTISAPQDIATTSTPTFNQIRLTASPVNNYFLRSDVSGNGSWAPISSHAITDIFGTANQINVSKNINNEATLSTPQNLDTACNFQTASTTASNIINTPTLQITDIPGAQWRLTFGNFNLNFFKQNTTSPYAFPTIPLIWFSNGDTINSSYYRAIATNINNPTYSFAGHLTDGLYHNTNSRVGIVNSSGDVHLDSNGDFHISDNLKLTNNTSIFIGSDEYKQADLNKITGITDGTASANKALVVDNQRRISNIDRITTNEASIANFITGTDFNGNNIFAVGVLSLENGTLSNNSLSFYNRDCGIYSSANRHMNFVCQAVDRFEIAHTGNTSKQSLSISSGSLNTNSLNSFSGSNIDINNKNLTNAANIICSSTNPYINLGASGFGVPTFTTQSNGTKIILWNQLDGTNANYSIGIEGGHVWLNAPQDNSGNGIKFYLGTTEKAKISTSGLFVNGIQPLTGTDINFNNANLTNVNQMFLNQMVFGNGTVTAPAISFITNEGFYRPSKDNLSLTLNGVQRVNFSTTQLNTSLNILAPTLDLSSTLTVGGLTTLNGNAITNGTHSFNNTISANSTVNLAATVNCQSTSTLNINGSLSSSASATLALNNLLTITNTTTAGNLYLQNNHTTASTNLRMLHLQSNLTTQTPYMQINRNNTVSDLEMGVAGYNGSLISDSLVGDTVIRSNNGRVIFGCGNRNIAEVRINNSNIGIPLWVDTGFGINVNNFGYLNNGGSVGYYAGVPQNWAVSLYTGQAIVCNGQIMVISDKRTKHNINNIDDNIIENFLKIDTKEFTKDGQNKPQFGYMAQDLAKVSPNFVNLFGRDGVEEHIDEDGFVSPANALFSVNYECIDAVQHMIIKKQQARIKELELKTATLETQLLSVLERLNNIENLISE